MVMSTSLITIQDIEVLSRTCTLFLTFMAMLLGISNCARRRTRTRRVARTERTPKSRGSKSKRKRAQKQQESAEVSARSDVWDDYDKKIHSSESRTSGAKHEQKKIPSAEKKQGPSSGNKSDEPPKWPEAQVDFSEALKKPPPDVDLNDFIVRAAMAQTVVNPLLVKKIGNIDDESADPKKQKAQLEKLEEEMKSKEDKEEEEKDKKDFKSPAQSLKWGDHKCVLYETRDQLTLEDDAEDADLP
ncbi:unnamed protein product [Cylicocyclus nassatus]|uniref:Uncharacterized protein n=1 Tax=Cylicocyclus nassatus TaxID=53992 RepID=A0AA36GXJ6_CYLNA|nr:unnamed protein product [Cylicocyclus nassatus]